MKRTGFLFNFAFFGNIVFWGSIFLVYFNEKYDIPWMTVVIAINVVLTFYFVRFIGRNLRSSLKWVVGIFSLPIVVAFLLNVETGKEVFNQEAVFVVLAVVAIVSVHYAMKGFGLAWDQIVLSIQRLTHGLDKGFYNA